MRIYDTAEFTIACYDKQHVCTYPQSFSRYMR